MKKRHLRSELLFSLGFIFMLIVTVAAFLYGVQVGYDRTESKYEAMKQLNSEADTGPSIAYQQQDLVSYYHTVFLPFREFQNEWLTTMDKLRGESSADPVSALKAAGKLAKQQQQTLAEATLPPNTPLLEQSRVSWLESLRLFGQVADLAAKQAGDAERGAALTAVEKQALYTEAVQQAVQGQQRYYAAMLKWGASVDPDLPDAFEMPSMLPLADWSKQPLIVKNKIMADQLANRGRLTSYYPQDLAAQTDQLIASGEAANIKLTTVSAAVELLVGTGAVRSGDFAASKSAFYVDELLPQLPFFFPSSAG
ncbi:hypothetical protein IDH44_08340 [Paenibacillus sp. IB182496]|uniref:Uncharacterized protein n=1 Tax=Paenibacillus sabuli TaxID=2772509 RepID=A0A927BTM6_9BACL|nr:hypothetical protein [Paenibacillus sabuli]MBD2845198.1 hypothetical protein [Paenibacillus sabuli]